MGWLNFLQLAFNRSCYWFGKVLCSSHSIDFVTVYSVSCSWLDFSRSYYWYSSALCSLIAIEFVIALIQFPATTFQAILSLVDSVFCSLLSIDLVIGLLMKLVVACFQLILPFVCSAFCSLLSVDCVIGLAWSNPCSLFSIDLVIGLLSYSQLDLSGSCYWMAKLFAAWYHSILPLGWPNFLLLDFYRACYCFGSAICNLTFQGYCHWFVSVPCSLPSIDHVIGLVQLSAVFLQLVLLFCSILLQLGNFFIEIVFCLLSSLNLHQQQKFPHKLMLAVKLVSSCDSLLA